MSAIASSSVFSSSLHIKNQTSSLKFEELKKPLPGSHSCEHEGETSLYFNEIRRCYIPEGSFRSLSFIQRGSYDKYLQVK
jgi:hypothetical protein